jgi:hypothetical protein
MLPHNKLTVFAKDPDWRAEDTAEVKRIVQKRWDESYAPRSTSTHTAEQQQPASVLLKVSILSRHRYVQS